MQKLNGEKIEELITLIKEKRILYDKKERLYRNNEAKEKIWSEIAMEMHLPVNDCKTAWKSLRDQYGKYLKESKTLSGQAFEAKKPYKYSEHLAFLKDSMQPRKTTGNFDEIYEEIEEVFALNTTSEVVTNDLLERSSDCLPSTSRRSRSSTPGTVSKRLKKTDDEYSDFLQKLIEINEKSSEGKEQDRTHKFFASLADTVSSFNLPPLELMRFENNVHSYCLQLLSEWEQNNNKN